MSSLKAHVVNGRIVVDEPVDLPDGTELAVYVVDASVVLAELRARSSSS